MVETAEAEQVRMARITVTVRRPEWGGPATLHSYDWRLAAWDELPPAQLQHVVYIPGAFGDFAPGAPATLLRAAAQANLPLHVTAVDLPQFQASQLPPGWAGRMARAGSFIDDAHLLQAVLERVAPGRHTIVGWSTGAVQATLLAALAPDRVAAIQLCMPAGFFTQPVLTRLTPRFLRTTLTTRARAAHRPTFLGSQPLQKDLEVLRSMRKLPAILQMIRLLGRDSAVPYAAQVRCPVVFVLARHDIVFDRLIPMSETGQLAAFFPQAPSVTVHILEADDANHNAFSTHQADVAAITLATVKRET
jgi:pimeloyl-ACP methyl ester carboxylesterase